MHSNEMKVEMTCLWVDADSSNINLNQFAFTPQFGEGADLFVASYPCLDEFGLLLFFFSQPPARRR